MPANIITPEFRAAFISVFRPFVNKNDDGTEKRTYSVRACFPPETDMTALKAAASEAASEKWGDKVPKSLRSPFRKNDELDNPVPNIGPDWTIMTFSAKEDRRPGIVDASVQDIIDETEVYSGAWYRAQIRPFAYETAGNRGVSFGLQNLQKLRDDSPMGASRIPASQAFQPVAGASATSGKGAGSLFD